MPTKNAKGILENLRRGRRSEWKMTPFFFTYITCIVTHMKSKFTKCSRKGTKNQETKSK